MKTLIALPLAVLLAGTAAVAEENFGVIRATTKLRPDGSTSTTIVNPEQRTAEETVRDAGGKVQKKVVYLLGDRDLSVGAIYYNAKGQVTYKASYKRDGAGHVAESSFTSADGRYLGKRVFFYSGDNVVRVDDYDASNRLMAPPATGTSSRKKK